MQPNTDDSDEVSAIFIFHLGYPAVVVQPNTDDSDEVSAIFIWDTQLLSCSQIQMTVIRRLQACCSVSVRLVVA